jgi:orotidine-5'-phosphate decarboxylase
VSTPSQAILDGADHIVVGRPIYKSKNPLESYLSIASEIANVKSKN